MVCVSFQHVGDSDDMSRRRKPWHNKVNLVRLCVQPCGAHSAKKSRDGRKICPWFVQALRSAGFRLREVPRKLTRCAESGGGRVGQHGGMAATKMTDERFHLIARALADPRRFDLLRRIARRAIRWRASNSEHVLRGDAGDAVAPYEGVGDGGTGGVDTRGEVCDLPAAERCAGGVFGGDGEDLKGGNCPAGQAHCAWGGHFVTCVGLRVVLPMVADWISCRPTGGLREALRRACERPVTRE